MIPTVQLLKHSSKMSSPTKSYILSIGPFNYEFERPHLVVPTPFFVYNFIGLHTPLFTKPLNCNICK